MRFSSPRAFLLGLCWYPLDRHLPGWNAAGLEDHLMLCLLIPWSLQWFLCAAVILFTPVSQIHLFAFPQSRLLSAAIWGADCLGLTPLPTERSALLTQSGPGPSPAGRAPGQDLGVCPHQGTAFPDHPLLSVLATLQSVPYSQQSRLPATSPNPPDTWQNTLVLGSEAQFQDISPPSCHPLQLLGVAPLTLFNWRTPTCLSWVSPGSPPLWSLPGLHHLPKLRQTQSFCFLCLLEEFSPRAPPASVLSSHGDAFRLTLLPPFVWVILWQIPNLHYRFTPQGDLCNPRRWEVSLYCTMEVLTVN